MQHRSLSGKRGFTHRYPWAFLAVLTVIRFTLLAGAGVQFPPQWSWIQHLFDSDDEIYPQDDQEASSAYNALYGEPSGDMKFPASEASDLNQAGIRGVGFRWPGYPGNGTIPYVIDDSLSSITNIITSAMDQYHATTCIRFVQRTTEADYIRLIRGQGCSSFVGRIGGRQDVNLGRGCEYVGTVVHELGHAVGLYHEHQRTDRDRYIRVFIQNVQRGYESNFDITPANEELMLSDFNEYSIMIYGEYSFSVDPGNRKTMEALNRSITLTDPFAKPGLSNMDSLEIRRLYECL